MDEIQRKILSKEELDDVYLTTTNQLEVINKLKTESPTAKELEQYMKKIKQLHCKLNKILLLFVNI